MEFEIDVSGDDLLQKDYTICIANKTGIVRGFKFNNELISILSAKYGQGHYKYKKSRVGKANFKIRLYCIVIYYLFKSLNIKSEISLKICRDFIGREDDINKSLEYFLGFKLGLNLNDNICFCKLSKESIADRYAYLMRKDKKNLMRTYISLNLLHFEKWMKK